MGSSTSLDPFDRDRLHARRSWKMIKIHRSKPFASIDSRSVKLTKSEHALITTLGMMDNKITPHNLLLDVMCENCARIPDDKNALTSLIYRLRKKIGPEYLQCKLNHGYILAGEVHFVG
jgi:DNA-binding response OmpR family regulator